MGKGLLFAALSGAGNSIAKSAGEYQKFQDETAMADKKMADERTLMQERAKLEEEKQLRIDEIIRNRNEAPVKRFGASVAELAQKDVPVAADPVTRTTSEGAKAAGLKDGLIGMSRKEVEAYGDPDMLAQYDKQLGADNSIAQELVKGKTRKMTGPEAIKAAIDKAEREGDLQGAEAGNKYVAGTQSKADLEERRLTSKEKIAEMQEAGKERRHREDMDAVYAKIDAVGKKSGSDKTALIQNAEYLKSLGYSDEKIEKFIFEKKEISKEDVAAKILAADPYGNVTPEQAAAKAIALHKALNPDKSAATSNGAPPDGTRLKKGGQTYIVKNGVPVLESEASRTAAGKIK